VATTLTTARALVRQFARNAGESSMYSDADVDRAIQAIGDDWIHHTRCTRTLSDLSLTADDSDLPSLSSLATAGFLPEQIVRVYIASEGDLSVVPHETLLYEQEVNPRTDTPEWLAFTTATAGEVYPTPDTAYTLKVLWVPPLTSFTAGTASPDAVSLNIPDHHLRLALIYGATALLQHNEVEHAYATASWQKYLVWRASHAGTGGMGAKTIRRSKEREARQQTETE
jgi:hypothetical protein